MLRLIFVLATALGLLSAATPVATAATPADCPLCDAYNKAIEEGKRPTDTALSCFYIEQEGVQAVPLFIHRADGTLINADPYDSRLPKPTHRKVKQATDSYCVGRHYVEEALAAGGWVELCNGDPITKDGWRSNRIEGDALRAHLDAGDAPQTLATTVCLMNGPKCDARLALRQVSQ